jgi:uncharacterized protein (TIGR02452 family)
MSTIYHDYIPFCFRPLPNNWVKDELFEPYCVDEKNNTCKAGDVQGRFYYRLTAKYEEHYSLFSRIGRAFLGVILILTVQFAFKSGRERIGDLFYTSVENIHLIRLAIDGDGEEAYIRSSIVSPELASRLEEINKIKCPIARETGIAATQGFYINSSGNKIPLRSGAELFEGSRLVSNTILDHPVEPKYEECEILVLHQDCLEAAQLELNYKAKKVAVLMLASPIEPGGGMEDGNIGQEEDLCRRSDIFGFMWDQSHFMEADSLYNLVDVQQAHQVNPQYSSMTNNRMIHVPQVTVFRSGTNDDYKMLEPPFEVGMLVSPGLDRPKYEKVDGKTRYTRVEDEEQLRKLIMTQLKVAYDENYDTVILGAFGCGAFYNPPELVAEFYKQIIGTYFKGAFEKIVFAILDDGHPLEHNPEGNLKPFQECFESHFDTGRI